MKTAIYSVRDAKTGAFKQFHFEENDVQATRGLCVACRDSQCQLSMFPEEFDLYHHGNVDIESGKITALEQPRFVISAINCMPKKGEKDESGN
jgi:hypothetical protein